MVTTTGITFPWWHICSSTGLTDLSGPAYSLQRRGTSFPPVNDRGTNFQHTGYWLAIYQLTSFRGPIDRVALYWTWPRKVFYQQVQEYKYS